MVFNVGNEKENLKTEGWEEKAYPLPGSNVTVEGNVEMKKCKRAKGLCCFLPLLVIMGLLATSIYFGYQFCQYKRLSTKLLNECPMRIDDGGLYDNYNLAGDDPAPQLPPNAEIARMPPSEIWKQLAAEINECVVGFVEEETTDLVDPEDDEIEEEDDDVQVTNVIDPSCLAEKILNAKDELKMMIKWPGVTSFMQYSGDRNRRPRPRP